jgi:hypothetical protein
MNTEISTYDFMEGLSEPELAGRGQPKEFFKLSEPERESLKVEIENSKGTIRLFVHPFFDFYNSIEPKYMGNLVNAKFVRQGMDKILHSSKTRLPVLIMEEEPFVDTTLETLRQTNPENSVYVVPTEEEMSVPIAMPYKQPQDSEGMEQNYYENWRVFIAQLSLLGVKKILVGGSFFWADNKGGIGVGKGSGCMGSAIKQLRNSKDFEVIISHFSNPHGRKMVEELGNSDFAQNLRPQKKN